MLNSLKDFWVQKRAEFVENPLIFLKHLSIWFLIHYIISLLPVLFVLGADYLANSGNFDYSDTVFLSIISFSFTLLAASCYSMIVLEEAKLLRGTLAVLFLFVFLCLYVHFYIEDNSTQFFSDNKFTMVHFTLAVTFILSISLNWSTIKKCQYNEIRRKERKKLEESKEESKDEYDRLKTELG